MTTLSRGSRRDAEALVRTAAHVAAPAPTGTAASAVPWAGPAAPAGAAPAFAARFPRAAKNVITAPMATRRRAASLTWNLTQATDWDLVQATDWNSGKRQAGTSGKRN
jgi:hypothetical protein